MRRLANTCFKRPSTPNSMMQKRYSGWVHGFMRDLLRASIPSVDLEGQKIDADEVLSEFHEYVRTLQETVLFDRIHLMDNNIGTWESIFPADILTHYSETLLPTPIDGKEHRLIEQNDLLRYVKSAGSTGTSTPLLQGPHCKANGGDFINLPMGLLCAETSRTNHLCLKNLKDNKIGESQEEAFAPFPTYMLNLTDFPDAPPVGDFFGFAGQSTLLTWDCPYGMKVTGWVTENIKQRVWEVIKLEEGCNFISFHGGFPKWDVIVDEEFIDSIEALGNAGFNPVPCKWKCMRRLGVSMRQCILVLRFSRGGYGASGMHNHDMRKTSETRVVTSGYARQKIRNEHGAPLRSQIQSGEMVEPIYQEPPRYQPPMHRKGGLVPHEGERIRNMPTIKRPDHNWRDKDGDPNADAEQDPSMKGRPTMKKKKPSPY